MYKVIVEYARINRTMKIKFNLILKDDSQKFNAKLLDKFNINGNDYLKINPHPYLTIDISSKDEAWSNNNTVSLNSIGLFLTKRRLREAIDNLKTEDLFMYVNNRLILNKSIAKTKICKFMTNGKYVILMPSVVTSEEEIDDDYEGLCFVINTIDNFCLLTIDEAEYLFDTLNKIDLNALALQVINTSILMKQQASKPITIVSEEKRKDDEDDVTINFTTKKDDKTIPDI